MENEIAFFTLEQGNLLIRILIAHFMSDFVLQNTKMVETKKWFSVSMFSHISIVFGSTILLTGLWMLSLIIALGHWAIDGLKIELGKQYKFSQSQLFLSDQLAHVLLCSAAWMWHYSMLKHTFQLVSKPFTNYELSLYLLAYLWLIYPVGYIIKYVTLGIAQHTDMKPNDQMESNVEHGGKKIGQFERIIILTFVLLNQYEAIGFLITGKSIIRFADHNSNLRSEYVLVGTMMSYAIAILTGVFVNYLLK